MIPAESLRGRRRRRRALAAGAGCLLLLTSSCRLFQTAVEAPANLLGGSSEPAVPPSVLQSGVMRFADTFAARIVQATHDFEKADGSPEARIQAMSWVVGQNSAAFTIAAGSNPNANVLDMIMLVTLGRMIHEEHWLPNVWGEADRPMLEAFQKLEAEIWEVAARLLTPEQQDAVREALRSWRQKNPDMAVTAFVRLPAFQDILMPESEDEKGMFSELSGLVSLDPLAGLEPTVREIKQTRLLAERTLYYLQRLPLILSVQAELLGLELTRMPAVTAALEDSQRFSEAAHSLATTAETLPEAVRVEREAAVRQISEELTLQRQGLVGDLQAAEEPSRAILTEARATLAAVNEASAALQPTIQALDEFIGGFRKKAPPPGTPPAPEPPAKPGKPFDVTEYGAAAAEIGAAAGELHRLVATLEQSLPEAKQLMDEVAERADRAIDRAFVRGLALGAALIAAAALAVLGVRWTSARWARARP